MSQATRASWKTLPTPDKREWFDVPDMFPHATADRMKGGHVPIDMDDRWFIYFEEGWLHFHRSWTGSHIFALKLDECAQGVRVIEAWASRELEQYRSAGIEHDRQTVVRLVRSYFDR